MANPLIIVAVYCTVLLIFLGVSFVKASYHMEYLKKMFPEQYGDYKTYFSVFTAKTYSVGLQFLFLPSFKRYPNEENTTTELIARKVRLYQYLSFLLLIVLILPILIGILQ